MNLGFFCVLEGIDGSGKTTLINALRDRFLEQGLGPDFGDRFNEFQFLCEPTIAASGRRIREHLKKNDHLTRREWMELFHVDRSMNVENNIKPALQKNALVIQDRYFYSTAAYQGDPLVSPTPTEIVLQSRQAGFVEPDLVVYLDLDPQEAIGRIQKSRQEIEVFEKQSTLQKIWSNYTQILPKNTLRLDAKNDVKVILDTLVSKIKIASQLI